MGRTGPVSITGAPPTLWAVDNWASYQMNETPSRAVKQAALPNAPPSASTDKFKYRYSTLGFQDAANLDDDDMWPVYYALKKWNPIAERKVAELVKAAIS